MEEGTGTETTGAQENLENQEQGNQQGSQEQGSTEVVGALGALGAFINPKTLEEVAAATKNNQPAKNESQEQVDNSKKAPEAKEEKPNEGQKNPNEVKEVTETKSVLGLNKQKAKVEVPVIENENHILEVIKKDFGQEYKGISEMPKFFETAKQWRNDSQAYKKTKAEYDNIVTVLENTPQELLEAIQKYHKGEDYMKVFENKPAFNFDLPAEKQDIKSLVKHYYPNEFAEEDFEEGNETPALKIAKQASVDKYNYTKLTRDNERATREKNASVQLENMKNSVSSSVDYLKKSFPDADNEVVDDIHKTLEGGIQKVAELLYNSDGTAKPEAAEMLLMLKHGKSEISRMMQISANQAESRVNEEIVSRGADTKKPVKTGQMADKISEGALEQLKTLSVFKSKQTF